MPRAIWKGAISFGLLNIPVELMPAESRIDLHFRLLDQRNKGRVRYERVNEDTGKEVPWSDVVKAFEYEKGSYVVVEEEDFKNAAPQSAESVDIEAFVDPGELSWRYLEKPYFLVPLKKAEKGYVLLRETLKKQKKVGLARVVVRTREYLSLVSPEDDALVLYIVRYPQELVDLAEYKFPDKALKGYRVTPKEMEMAEALVTSMTAKFKPSDYKDEFRAKLSKAIDARIKKKGVIRKPKETDDAAPASSGKVVDFMSLLKQSIDTNKRTPAKKHAGKAAPAKKAGAKKAVTRKRLKKAS